jgi:aminotransferase in exopolysaccharide biosynthesis
MNHLRLVKFIRDIYGTDKFIPLHAPLFGGNEKKYVDDAIESTYVSSVGEYVDRFEKNVSDYTKSVGAVATVNGTAALHVSLLMAGVTSQDLVITQALTFVGTVNAITYTGASLIFLDVDKKTFGLSDVALASWLEEFAFIDDKHLCRLKVDGRVVRACVPVHIFGHPAKIDLIYDICKKWGINLVEDSAESLGSLYKGKHTGTFGMFGAISFNGNKIITTGGGGMVLCDADYAKKLKHITTTAKVAHPYNYFHDQVAFNYRLPNINAAIGCAQLENLESYISNKRDLARIYQEYFANGDEEFVKEPEFSKSNYWLNAIICESLEHRDELLKFTNHHGVMTRPIWTLMNKLPIFKNVLVGDLTTSEWLESRVVNLPSSVRVV